MKSFKAESKRLLDMMIHSIYTNKEIFLRELISNASDAIDKRRFASLTDATLAADFKIVLQADKALRELTITDNGCGMGKEALESNLGTIAKSGTLAFKEEHKTDENLIGQFGVGFYASFMVADKVTVISRPTDGDNKAYKWVSTGADGYEIIQAERAEAGTTVILHIKDNDDDCNYDEFLEESRLKSLVKKYSDYIRYPIVLGEDTLNSMVPIWKKKKSEVKPEDYHVFYREKFFDFADPVKVITAQVEGAINYSTLLFIPKNPPFDYYSKDFQKGLKLYSNGVLIMDKCADLLPDCFGFIRGLVDSPDLSLNISRELLQKDRQLRAIASSLEKKIVAELKKMQKSEREAYDGLFGVFGNSIKMGAYENYGEKKEQLKDLLQFSTSSSEKSTTFAEYVARMKEGQSCIYYATGDKAEKIAALPQTERLLKEGYEILYLTDSIDEFVLKVIEEYEGKKFKSASAKDAVTETEEQKSEVGKKTDDNKALLEKMKTHLAGKVSDVRLTGRLVSHAVCLTSDSEVSLEMEKVLNAMPGGMGGAVKAARVLEINPDHAVFGKLSAIVQDEEKLKDYSKILYDTALLQEGLAVDDNLELAGLITKLL